MLVAVLGSRDADVDTPRRTLQPSDEDSGEDPTILVQKTPKDDRSEDRRPATEMNKKKGNSGQRRDVRALRKCRPVNERLDGSGWIRVWLLLCAWAPIARQAVASIPPLDTFPSRPDTEMTRSA